MATPHSRHDLSHLLSHIERRVVARQRAALEPEGCGVEEWRVLNVLSDATGHTMSEVADEVSLPSPTLTKLVDRLVANNLVYRRVDLEDRRRVRVFLTPRGKSLHRRLSGIVEDSQAELLAATWDGEMLRELLVRLGDALDGRTADVTASPSPAGR
jgi:DNA-binding MarR family transcriptional regulator